MALHSLKKFEELEENVSFDKIETYVKKLANMEHLIIDIADGKAIFAEIGDEVTKCRLLLHFFA